MAKVVKEIPNIRQMGPQKYPWNKWLDGRVWQLNGGKDFTSKPSGMAQQAYSAARKMGVKVQTAIRGNRVFLKATPITKGKTKGK